LEFVGGAIHELPFPRILSVNPQSTIYMKSPSQLDLPTFWAPVDISRAAFVATNAVVIGQVSIESDVSIWYGAVVRGDVERIEIGTCTNIQDGAIIHGDPGKPTILESYVTVGHRAVIHSAYIETGCLIGIGAIILDGVRIGSRSIIGAGCVVTKDVPPRSLMVGVPAKCLRQVDDAEAEGLILHARKYQQLALVHAGKGTNLGFIS
jgi:carbonic anhydrase/acetyltransferase-like protein (isoleucine patch superfamily)